MDKRRALSHKFGSPTVVSTDAEVSKAILQSDANEFVPCYPFCSSMGACKGGCMGSCGPFFKSSPLVRWGYCDVQDEAKNIAFQILVKALISLDPGEDTGLLKQQFQKFISGLISMPINFPKEVGSPSYSRKDMGKKSGTPKDVVHVLHSDNSSQLAKDLTTNNIIDLMMPGEDCVPVLITLAVKFLSDCPLALQKLAVITETLRMGNIIVRITLKALRDVNIKGHHIPKDWCVLTYFISIHLDEHHYEDACQFNPWRWMYQDFGGSTFTPFGGGLVQA